MSTPANLIEYARSQSEYWARILHLLEEVEQLIAVGAPQPSHRPPTPPADVVEAIREATRHIHYPKNGEPTTTDRIRKALHLRGPLTAYDLTAVLLAEGWLTASTAPRNVVAMALSKGAGTLFRVASAHGVRPKVWGLKRPAKAAASAAEPVAADVAAPSNRQEAQ